MCLCVGQRVTKHEKEILILQRNYGIRCHSQIAAFTASVGYSSSILYVYVLIYNLCKLYKIATDTL